MRSVKSFIAAAAVSILSTAAFAADMPIMPPPAYGPPVAEFGGWYLRGDIGFSNQRVDRLNNLLDRNNTSGVPRQFLRQNASSCTNFQYLII